MLNKVKLSAICLVFIFSLTILSTLTSISAFAAGTSKMVDMHEITSASVETRDEITDSYGKSYTSNILAFDARKYGYVKYELKGNYSKFDGNLVAANTTSSDAKMMMSIYADGKEIYTLSGFTKQMDAQSIELDLNGVNVLEFKARDLNEVYDAWVYITDGVFTQSEKQSLSYPEWDLLSDVVLVDSGNYGSTNNMRMDSYGELYFDGYSFDARKSAYALYNLNKGYEKFSGYIWPQRNASDKTNIR